MAEQHLRQFHVLQAQVEAALSDSSTYAVDDVMATFVRLRAQARELNDHCGWSAEEFDREVPPWTELPAVAASRIGAITGNPGEMLARLERLKHQLRQLGAWVSGNLKAIEFERKLHIEAEEKTKQASRRPPGFTP